MRYRGGGVGHKSTRNSPSSEPENDMPSEETVDPPLDSSIPIVRDLTIEELDAFASAPALDDAPAAKDNEDLLSDEENNSQDSHSDNDEDNDLGAEDGEEPVGDLLAQEGYDQF